MAANNEVFRRQLRFPVPADEASIDALVIRQMQRLESDSPFRMQEWVRNALRRAFVEEAIAQNGASEELRAALDKLSPRGLA